MRFEKIVFNEAFELTQGCFLRDITSGEVFLEGLVVEVEFALPVEEPAIRCVEGGWKNHCEIFNVLDFQLNLIQIIFGDNDTLSSCRIKCHSFNTVYDAVNAALSGVLGMFYVA